MKTKTLELIAVCKRDTQYSIHGDVLENIRDFLAEDSGVSREYITNAQIRTALKVAMYEYIDVCEKPSLFLACMEGIVGRDITWSHRVAMALSAACVYDETNHSFRNGFDQRYYELVENMKSCDI